MKKKRDQQSSVNSSFEMLDIGEAEMDKMVPASKEVKFQNNEEKS